MATLTPKGRALALNAAERGHVTHRSDRTGGKVEVTCSCGRLKVTVKMGPDVVDAIYDHFNREAR